jgi:hypothetical protein
MPYLPTAQFHQNSKGQTCSSESSQVDFQLSDNGIFSSNHSTTLSPQDALLDISCLIHKFESLDSHANTPIWQPSPLRTSQDGPRDRTLTFRLQERNLVTSGPARKNITRFGNILTDGEVISVQEDVFKTPSHKYDGDAKRLDSNRLHQNYIPHKACGIRLRAAPPPRIGDSLLEESIFSPHSRNGMATSSRGSTVKEKIRFYNEFRRNTIAPCKIHLLPWSLADVVLSWQYHHRRNLPLPHIPINGPLFSGAVRQIRP